MTPDVRSTAIALLSELTRRGMSLRAEGESIKVKPAGLLTDADRQRIAASRPAVLAILQQRATPRPSPEAPPVRCWYVDRLDLRVMVACGIMPTPDVADLPTGWRQNYETVVARLVAIGVHRERAEVTALRETMDAMAAAGDFMVTDWSAEA